MQFELHIPKELKFIQEQDYLLNYAEEIQKERRDCKAIVFSISSPNDENALDFYVYLLYIYLELTLTH